MVDSLSVTHNHQETFTLEPCDSCDRWERQFTIQSNALAQLQNKLADRDQQLARLGQDMQHLNTKYVAAIDRVADVQHEKDLVEHDLEELSCKLFEQANDMVATEKREKWVLETQLQTVQQQLMDEQAQLKELRQRLLDWDSDEQKKQQRNQQQQQSTQSKKQPRRRITLTNKRKLQYYPALTTIQYNNNDKTLCYTNDDDNDDDGAGDDENDDGSSEEEDTWEDAIDGLDHPQVRAYHDLELFHDDLPKQQQQQKQSDLTITNMNNQNPRYATSPPMIDLVQIEAFQKFVQAAGTMPLKKLRQVAYVKYCQLEDVEPCLRFGPHSRLSTKKMMNHLLHQSCFIQHMCLEPYDDLHPTTITTSPSMEMPSLPSSVAQRPLLWDRWHQSTATTPQNSSPVMTCAACGRSCHNRTEFSSLYQFKMDEKDTWLPMDQYCRDRLVAVCEFFVFIRNIHLRLYSHRTIDDLYSENIRLRLQMFYSRVGALPVILNGMGLNTDAIGKACPPLDQDDISDGSLSNYCPTTPK